MRKQAGVVALLGALLVVTSDFAGWYTRSSGLGTSVSPSRTGSAAQNLFFSYTASEATDTINVWGAYLPLLLVVIGLLGLTAWLTLRVPPPPSFSLPMGVSLWMVPALAAAATLAFGLIFVITMLVMDPEDWWLDVGFFAGAVSGVSAAALLRRERAPAS